MIIQYVDHFVAISLSATGQEELQYILCNVPTGVVMSQTTQVPTVPRVSFPALSIISGSQIRLIVTEAPTNPSQYSLTDCSVGSTVVLCVFYFLSWNICGFHRYYCR